MKSRLGPGIVLVVVLLTVPLSHVPFVPEFLGAEQGTLGEQSVWDWSVVEAAAESAPRSLSLLGDEAPVARPTPVSGAQPEGWAAAETSVSRLGAGERGRLCGVPLEVIEWEEEQANQQPPMLSANYSYPPALDWRSYGGMDWTTPIRDQGECASCAAFATAGAIESRVEIAQGNAGLNPNLSEGHTFFCGCGSCCGSGWYPNQAMDFARDTGVVDEVCFPYADQNQSCDLCGGWRNRVTQISDWEGITSVDEMKQTLVDHGPFQATMRVYTDFFDYAGGVYAHTWGALEGGHAVTIVGYDDYQGYWIAKNSWGTGWGEAGWFRIAYGECAIESYAYVPILPEASYHLSTSTTPSQGGTIDSNPSDCASDTCEPGTEVELVVNPSPGYEFSGWSADLSGTSNPASIIMDADKAVTAHFIFPCDGCVPQLFVPLALNQ